MNRVATVCVVCVAFAFALAIAPAWANIHWSTSGELVAKEVRPVSGFDGLVTVLHIDSGLLEPVRVLCTGFLQPGCETLTVGLDYSASGLAVQHEEAASAAAHIYALLASETPDLIP